MNDAGRSRQVKGREVMLPLSAGNTSDKALCQRDYVGMEIADFPEHVIYNFGCPCGWWGIARIPREHAQATCAGCGVSYRQWKDGETWHLSGMLQ